MKKTSMFVKNDAERVCWHCFSTNRSLKNSTESGKNLGKSCRFAKALSFMQYALQNCYFCAKIQKLIRDSSQLHSVIRQPLDKVLFWLSFCSILLFSPADSVKWKKYKVWWDSCTECSLTWFFCQQKSWKLYVIEQKPWQKLSFCVSFVFHAVCRLVEGFYLEEADKNSAFITVSRPVSS